MEGACHHITLFSARGGIIRVLKNEHSSGGRELIGGGDSGGELLPVLGEGAPRRPPGYEGQALVWAGVGFPLRRGSGGQVGGLTSGSWQRSSRSVSQLEAVEVGEVAGL